nr:hypothetical protein [uncultured Sphingomonas sp.]
MLGWSQLAVRDGLNESVIASPQGGSDLKTIRDRIVLQNAPIRRNPVLIWDGAPNGYTLGNNAPELELVRQIASFKGDRQNWLLILPLPIFRDIGPQLVADLRSYKNSLINNHGAVHFFDPMPIVISFADGSPEDTADVAAGLVPRSVLFDGVHIRDDVKRAVMAALTAPGGPMEQVRKL